MSVKRNTLLTGGNLVAGLVWRVGGVTMSVFLDLRGSVSASGHVHIEVGGVELRG